MNRTGLDSRGGTPFRRTDRRSRGGEAPLGARIFTGFVAAVFLLSLFVWFRGNGRADEAVDDVLSDAREYRDTWAETPAARRGPAPLPEGELTVASLEKKNRALESRLSRFAPRGLYIVIDSANNRFFMKRGDETLIEADCSTGSLSKLNAPDGRSWFFHTPRGRFSVISKKQNPVWVKPDWAFVEEEEPIPGAGAADRYEPYVMGDYALYFGNGYYIHGTLYRRLLGQSVTHGCVRLGDEELEQVYKTAPIGTPIFIY